MLVEELNEEDARQAIETLMDEEAEIAEDPTQNAMLSPAQKAKSAPEMEPPDESIPEPDLGAATEGAADQSEDSVAPTDVDVATEDESNAIQVPESAGEGDSGNSIQVPESEDAGTPDPVQVPDLPLEDESDEISLPDVQDAEAPESPEPNMDEIEPTELPPVPWNERPDPDWDDAIQDMMMRSFEEHQDTSEADPPEVDSAEDESNWQQSLADRNDSL